MRDYLAICPICDEKHSFEADFVSAGAVYRDGRNYASLACKPCLARPDAQEKLYAAWRAR